MDKPPYEIAPLRLAVIQCDLNIGAFQKGIDDELKHKSELQECIDKHEKYLKWLRNKRDE